MNSRGESLLASTFQHLDGISSKREHQLWMEGVKNWDDYQSVQDSQLVLFEDVPCTPFYLGFEQSRKALESGDAEFFARRLIRPDHYRIALAFPEKTLFLDIETTGLSLYYDTITLIGWSMSDRLGFLLPGDPIDEFSSVLSDAKVLVTFNGSLFDLRFIRKQFPQLNVPPAHVDLRFLARRVGLNGGQKRIEDLLELKRPDSISGMDGKTAPVLWHEYCFGMVSSLETLLNYNYCDIQGMKLIFDRVVDMVMEKDQMPSWLRSHSKFGSVMKLLGEESPLHGELMSHQPFVPRITLKDLGMTDQCCFVGIDLTASEKRASGFCALRGNEATTSLLSSDDEIVATVVAAKPKIVSIDSPLSLPFGRSTVSDEDPNRKSAGIMRHCERILKKRGINVYPCLIKSMQMLTQRGMRLAAHLRSLGIPVIESYPGAAQDIMGIPRKGSSIELLKKGLIRFGIEGDFVERAKVTHDELDAITSALVAGFFWSGAFEALGTEEEGFLIVPDLRERATMNLWQLSA
jgi:predicted nuclease with RNAse H fold/uncharacterized protein YprB with RNaseH-like and TPR domain